MEILPVHAVDIKLCSSDIQKMSQPGLLACLFVKPLWYVQALMKSGLQTRWAGLKHLLSCHWNSN